MPKDQKTNVQGGSGQTVVLRVSRPQAPSQCRVYEAINGFSFDRPHILTCPGPKEGHSWSFLSPGPSVLSQTPPSEGPITFHPSIPDHHPAYRLSCCIPCLLFLETHILVKLKCIIHLLGTEFIENTLSGQDIPFRSDFEANLTNSQLPGLGFTGSVCFSLSDDIPR